MMLYLVVVCLVVSVLSVFAYVHKIQGFKETYTAWEGSKQLQKFRNLI